MKEKDIYAWIAETSYWLRNSPHRPISFHPVPAKRDATTRINVQVGDKNRVCVIATRNEAIEYQVMTPRDVYEHFNPRDKETNKRTYVDRFEPDKCRRCEKTWEAHGLPGYYCYLTPEEQLR